MFYRNLLYTFHCVIVISLILDVGASEDAVTLSKLKFFFEKKKWKLGVGVKKEFDFSSISDYFPFTYGAPSPAFNFRFPSSRSFAVSL